MPCKIVLKSKSGSLSVGKGFPVRVNCNIGANNVGQLAFERERLRAVKDSAQLPDTFMDLSIGQYAEPLYKDIIRDFGCPVGTVPAYLFPSNEVVTKEYAIDILKRLADDGLSFFTLHLTADNETLEIARRTRKIPVTSRGGSIVLRQTVDNGNENIWVSILPQVIDIAKSYGIVVSIGATFRPAGIQDACDEVHLRETEAQLKYCRLLQGEGVQVMVENVGHIAINQLEQHCERLRAFDAPIMPLGPVTTDAAVDADQIASAIGAAFMGYWDCAHIINCVTRSEHSKSRFSIDDTLEAIRAAKVAAHSIDVAKGVGLDQDSLIYGQRATQQNCLAGVGTDCSRCAGFCPVKQN